MTQDHGDQMSCSEAAGRSRRGILRMLGVGGASGLLAVAGLEVMAGDRPHQRLQDRTPKRNRKQRNKRQANNDNQNTNQNSNGGGGLGGTFQLGVSVEFNNPTDTTYNVRVAGENGDVKYVWGPGKRAVLSVTDDGSPGVTFAIQFPGWIDNLFIQAKNPAVGEPEVNYAAEAVCITSDGYFAERGTSSGFCDLTSNGLSVAETLTITWLDGKEFTVERQSDSSDYKMFLVTALS